MYFEYFQSFWFFFQNLQIWGKMLIWDKKIYKMQCNSRTVHFKTMVLMWLLISIKKAFQRCITWLYLEEFKKFLTSGQTKNPPFLKLQIPEARPTHGSFHPSFFVSLYTYLEGPKRISSSQANFYGIICQGLDYIDLNRLSLYLE